MALDLEQKYYEKLNALQALTSFHFDLSQIVQGISDAGSNCGEIAVGVATLVGAHWAVCILLFQESIQEIHVLIVA